MENFRIDFTLSNPFPDGKMLGEGGEKNAVQLIITPPENLASREEIRLYVVAFSTQKGPFRYGPVPKTDTVTVPVGNELTVGTALSVQLEGYDENGEFIIKSPVLSGIMISSSIGDCESSDVTSDGDNTIPGHFHKNLEILDSLSEENGVLLYKENSVLTSENIKTVVTDKFLPYSEFAGMQSICLVEIKNEEGVFPVPVGAEIISLEINNGSVESPVWVDLRDINVADVIVPCIINMHKVQGHSEFGDMPILATVFFPYDANEYYFALSNYAVSSIRVRYIEGNGDSE